jgi:hypothetical protein
MWALKGNVNTFTKGNSGTICLMERGLCKTRKAYDQLSLSMGEKSRNINDLQILSSNPL